MKQTRNISLAGIGFTFDEDAYTALEAYIAKLHRAYDSDPNGAEIIADIEGRIAELILAELSPAQVVSLSKINAITAQLGTPECSEEQSPQNTTSEPKAEGGKKHHTHTIRNIVLTILRIVAACTALWMLTSWVASVAVSFSATWIESVIGFTPLLCVVLGVISIPWLVLIYLLAVFAFNGRVRGWVIGLLIGLCILMTIIGSVKASRSPFTQTSPLVWSSIFHNSTEIAELKSIIESIEDIDIDEMFDQIDKLDYDGIHNVTHYSYEEIAEDGDTIMRYEIEFQNDNGGDVKIHINASPDYSSATIEHPSAPNTENFKKQIKIGPFNFVSSTHNAVIRTPRQITELDITPEQE